MSEIDKALSTVKFGKKSANPKVIILMGLPGSGKSLVANYLNEKYGFTILSGENISNVLSENDQNTDYVLVYKTLRQIASKLINENYSLVIDGTNLRFLFRKQIYDDVCQDTDHLLIYLTVNQETALKRIASRGENRSNLQNIKSYCSEETFKNFQSQLEEPETSEPHRKIKSDSKLFSAIDSILTSVV